MSRTYTTTDKVSNELNGFTIGTASTPSSTVVNSWIEEESLQIEKLTNGIYGTASFNTYYDYNGDREFRLNEKPIVSIGTARYEENGLGADSESWTTLTEGRTEDFITYKDRGIIRFIDTDISVGYQNFNIGGVYGYETTPKTVEQLCTLMTAKRVIAGVIQKQSTEEGGSIKVDVIELEDPSTFTIDNIERMNREIEQLKVAVGKLKSYRYQR